MSLLLSLLLACQPSPATPEGAVDPGPSGPTSVVVQGDTFEARVSAALKNTGRATLSEEGADYLKKLMTHTPKVMVDDASTIRNLPATGEQVLAFTPALQQALLNNDEAAAAKAIRDAGAKVLIVHADIRRSFDRNRSVISRLYHHDELSYFQLARVEDNALIYLVVDQPIQFPPELATASIHWLRDKLAGRNPSAFQSLKPERMNWTLMASIRGEGQEVAWGFAEADTFDVALNELADDLETWHRRNREVLGLPRLSTTVDTLRFEIHRVSERAKIVPEARGEETLEDLWEMGMDGAFLLDKKGKRSGFWPGAVASYRGIIKADSFLKAMARDFKMDAIRPWREPDSSLDLLRTIHYLEKPDHTGLIRLVRGTAPVPIEHVTIPSVKAAVVLAGEWYLANLQDDGRVVYKFWPEDNRYSDDYNHVRHELATWNLWQAWTLDPRPEFLAGAIKAQDWTLRSLQVRSGENLTQEWEKKKVDASPYKDLIYKEGMAYFTYDNNNKLGSNAVALYGMIEVARATNDHSKDTLIRQLANFILFSFEPNGRVRPYHVPAGHPYETQNNDIVPGEAALALVMTYEYLNDPKYLEVLPRFFAYYEPWFEERAARRKPGAVWPWQIYDNADRLELVQFGPWTVMAASAYTRVKPEEKKIAEFGLKVARWMVDAYAFTSDRTPYQDYIGGYYKFEGELPAMQAFCYGEGTAAAYDMAIRMAPEQAPYFERITRETVRVGLQMQHDYLDTFPYARPYQVIGGIKYAMNEPKVRIDYTYHAQSTMFQWLVAAQKDPNLAPELRAEPGPELRQVLALQGMPGYRTFTPNLTPIPAPVPAETRLPNRAAQAPAFQGTIPSSEKGDEGGE